VSANAIAEQYAQDRMILADQRQLSLFFEDGAESSLIHADPGLVGQAVSVLITNALNYTPPGGRVTVRTLTRSLDGQPWVGIQVADTGPGIEEGDLPHLFERFFRGKASLDSGTPGTGLGLAIAHQIVEEHGGTIEVSNSDENGDGACLTLWFPGSEQQPVRQGTEYGGIP
jgi:two-component system sensor histidine kinase BaeS